MPIHKIIEVSADSAKGWQDAAEKAVKDASRTVKGIKSVWVQDMSADVNDDGEIVSYRAHCKITFEVK